MSLYDFIFWYHKHKKGPRWHRAVDLGCGTEFQVKRWSSSHPSSTSSVST
ncbi:hypothetical protein BDR04DRAFT_1164210 [Suillus decipiens]|nr:hypothetical protein BDR04DRAFT_1164210 [Suillus decipiens]